MIELTDQAREMIGKICAQEGGRARGLRIARRRTGLGLWMCLAPAPLDGDVVVQVDDVRLYLDDAARARLAGKTLDARSDERGAAFFV